MAQNNNQNKINNSSKQITFKKVQTSVFIKELRKNAIKNTFRALAVFTAVTFLLLIFVNRSDLSVTGFSNWIDDTLAVKGVGPGYPVEITGGSSKKIENFGNSIIELTDTSFIVLNSTGKQAAARQHGFSSPQISAGDRYALLYDLNGTSYRIESVSKTIHSGSTEFQIISGDLSKSGVYALVTKDNSYLSTLYVYNKNNKELFIWQSANYHIISADVSPDGKNTAVVGISSENGKLKSCVMVFDYYQSKPSVEFSFYDNMLVSAQFTSSSKITAVGNNAAYVLDIKKETSTEIDYQNRILAGFDCDLNYGTALLLSKFSDRHNCQMVVIDENGKQLSSVSTDLNSPFVLLKGNEIFCISDNMLYKYNSKGAEKNKIPIGSNIKSCAVLGNNAYILGTSKVDKIRL